MSPDITAKFLSRSTSRKSPSLPEFNVLKSNAHSLAEPVSHSFHRKFDVIPNRSVLGRYTATYREKRDFPQVFGKQLLVIS